jgi:predicted ATP-grasp superfamily ATP-dependent carboligase
MVASKLQEDFKTISVNLHYAFVLGLIDPGLGAIRSLGRAGIPVVGFDFNPDIPGFKSRFCRPVLSPNPIYEPEKLVAVLLLEAKKYTKPPVLLPASDAYVQFISRFREQLQPAFLFILPPPAVLDAMVDKRLQYELAEQAGTPIPQTFYPQNMADVQEIAGQVTYPAFIKPYVGYLWREKFGIAKGRKVFNADELLQCYEEIFPTGLQAMVQTIVLGPNTNHFKVCVYMSRQGEPLLIFTLRKIRQYPTEFGVGTFLESLRYPELVDLGLHFLKSIGYVGIGSIEFKKDERDGQLKLIELNPRLWKQNILATDSGMNFSLVAYQDLTGHTPPACTAFREGVRWWDSRTDFQAFYEYYKRGEISILSWVFSWMGAESHQLFALDDLFSFR